METTQQLYFNLLITRDSQSHIGRGSASPSQGSVAPRFHLGLRMLRLGDRIPAKAVCFRSNNVNNFVTSNDTGELDSSLESPRWALQDEEDISSLGLKPTRPPVNCTMKDGTIDYI